MLDEKRWCLGISYPLGAILDVSELRSECLFFVEAIYPVGKSRQ